jgi:hypothetical protein
MKTCFSLLLLLSIAASGYAQTNDLTTLPCNAWGTPDWARLRKEDNKQKALFGSRYQKGDENIRLIKNGLVYYVYNDPIEIHWLIEDTAIYYDIKITDSFGETVYHRLTSNGCGVKIHLNKLLKETNEDRAFVQIERNKQHLQNKPNYTTLIVIRSLDQPGLSMVESSLKKTGADNKTAPGAYFRRASAFAALKLYFDAFTTLAEGVNNGIDKKSASAKYWEIIYDMYTISDDHLEHQR